MHWIVADLLMFASSVVTYLAIRKAALNKLPPQFNNLASFAIPAVIFTTGSIATKATYTFSLLDVALLVFTAVVLAYLSSKVSMMSIELAPNPGYSLIISKSYVVFTSLVAVVLFDAHLSALSMVAIAAIVGFSALIMLNPKESHHAKSRAWLPLALGAFFGWGMLSLVAKHFFVQGMPPILFLCLLSIVVLPCILVEMKLHRISFSPLAHHPGSFVLIGLAATSFNFFAFYAIKVAPNIGFVNATNAASIAAVTIFAIILFGDEFSWRKLLGVLGVMSGLVLLFFS